MKYAIILETINGDTYLKGFTNTSIEKSGNNTWTYTIELKELSSLHIPLYGDAKIYLS